MTITIMRQDNEQVKLSSKDKRFEDTWHRVVVPDIELFNMMSEIADWCNNVLGVECLFELE